MATDVVTEAANQGTDLVQSTVSWTLGSNLENLALSGTAAINGTGNSLGNVLTGNASAIGKVFCEHPAVRFVGFTGSTEVGKILYAQSAVGVKKLWPMR